MNSTTESFGGGKSGCVECHHTANIGNLDFSDSSPYLQGSLNVVGKGLGATASSMYNWNGWYRCCFLEERQL